MEFFEYFNRYYVEQIFGWNYIISMMIFSFQTALVMNSFKWNLKGILFKLLDCVITFALQILLFCFWEYFFGSHQYINYIVWPILIVIHFFYFCRYKFFDKLSKGVCLTIILYHEPTIFNTFSEIVGLDGRYFGVISTIAYLLAAVLIVIFLTKFTLKKTENINFICFFLMLFVVAFTIAFINVDLPEGEKAANAWSHIILYILMLTFALISYYYFYRLNVDFSNALESQALLIKEERNRKALETSRQNLEDLRKRRHDMKNQYQYMRLLLEQGNKEKLNEFFQRMIEGSTYEIHSLVGGDALRKYEEILEKEYPDIHFIYHTNIELKDKTHILEIANMLLSLARKNLGELDEVEAWIEGDENSILFTITSKEITNIDSNIFNGFTVYETNQKVKRNVLNTYKIVKNMQ